MTDRRRPPSLGDWVWNIALYPIAFGGLATVTVIMSRAGIGAQLPPDHPVISVMFGHWYGMLLYWTPGVVAAIAVLVVISRLLGPGTRRLVALVTPVSVVGAWIFFLFSSGYEFVYLASGPGSIAVEGWIATAVTLLVVGAVTRVAPQRDDRELGGARRTL